MIADIAYRPTPRPPGQKVCFVTVGATAAFQSLIDGVLTQAFIDALVEAHYTDLLIQYGHGGPSAVDTFHEQQENTRPLSVKIKGFAFNREGLGQEMRACKGGQGALEGVVISHAGTGCVLDALRLDVPLIVVPNPDLLDNHQLGLAKELDRQGYAVHGDLSDLPAAIRRVERLKQSKKGWPPMRSGEKPSRKGLVGVVDDGMAFLD
ncbi:MAG: hypothetical protein M1823_005702 [Watsoniomyces obsoletus]|nr:MAG: hypothetical protein M1823_005702 [Watsoniomyces obsoletus]